MLISGVCVGGGLTFCWRLNGKKLHEVFYGKKLHEVVNKSN